ncbi:MAG: hypothetical protein AB8G86_14785 [Saprospiraceae bacterium]
MTPNFNNNNKLNYFLSQYFYELEIILNTKAKEISSMKFQSEESNTDEYLKNFVKKVILQNKTLKNKQITTLSLTFGAESKSLKVKEFNKFRITNVFLPNELTADLKNKIGTTKSAVYTNPDLLLEIKGYNKTLYQSIELKSTKNNKIPGSSVQQVNPYEWVIFIKRKNDNIQVATGHYINSITEKLPFPDRSPRPQIGFNTLVDWNKKNRILSNQDFTYKLDMDTTAKKLKILADWQEVLVEEWMNIIQRKTKIKNEKWFNNTLRKFAIEFLAFSESLDEKELKDLKKRLTKFTNNQ